MRIQLLGSMALGGERETMCVLFATEGGVFVGTCEPYDLANPRESMLWNSIPVEVVRRVLALEIPT